MNSDVFFGSGPWERVEKRLGVQATMYPVRVRKDERTGNDGKREFQDFVH